MWRASKLPVSTQAALQLVNSYQAQRQAQGRASRNASRTAKHLRPVSPRQQAHELRLRRAKVEALTS